MIKYIHSTTILVADQDAALGFYTNTLGWEKGIDMSMGPSMRFLTVVPPGGKTQLALSHPSWYSDSGEAMPRKNTGIALIADDIEATYETLKERGVHFKKPLEVMPWGAKATWFTDIDDNEFFLVSEQV